MKRQSKIHASKLMPAGLSIISLLAPQLGQPLARFLQIEQSMAVDALLRQVASHWVHDVKLGGFDSGRVWQAHKKLTQPAEDAMSLQRLLSSWPTENCIVDPETLHFRTLTKN